MRLIDLATGHGIAEAFYAPEDDRLSTRKLSDTRKGDLTLKDLNRLKKLRALRKLEDAKRRDFCALMYGSQDPEEVAADLDTRQQQLDVRKRELEVETKEVELAVKRQELAQSSAHSVSAAATTFALAQIRQRK